MANLTETANFEANIYRIDQSDPVLGWDGTNLNIANLQAKALADRTQWLKSRVDLGARFTGLNAPAITVNNQVITATPDDLKGGLIRLNTTNGPSCNYELPDANTVADGANVTISHEINGTLQYVSSANYAVRVKAATGQNIVDLGSQAQANELVIDPNSIVRVFKISNTLWGMMVLRSESEIPPGIVSAWAVNSPPFGWLPCEGQAISRTSYARLFANIGTVFGTGNGTTTFNLPDLRGEFIRGWANARSVDTGRAFGSFQADELKAHTHSHNGSSNKTGLSSSAYGSNVTVASNILAGSPTSGPVSDSTGGTETRPRNVALMYCIKF
jgi:microcystin-dependent protein